MSNASDNIWISVREASALLKIRESTVMKRIEDGVIESRIRSDGTDEHEIPLSTLSTELQYIYLYSRLNENDAVSLDFGVRGEPIPEEVEKNLLLVKNAEGIKEEYRNAGKITQMLKKLVEEKGISLSKLYRITGKKKNRDITSLYLNPFYLQPRLPRTMCLWSCDLAFALYLDADRKYSQNDITAELKKKKGKVACTECPYSKPSSGSPECREKGEYMKTPNHRKTINRLLGHIPEEMILYRRMGYRTWRAKYGLFVMRERPLLVNESLQGDHHTFNLFVRVKLKKEHNGTTYEKETMVRPTLTAWMESASGCITGWVISIMPNSDTIAEAFARAVVLKPDSPFRGLPEIVIADCGKDYRSRLLEDTPSPVKGTGSIETALNRRFCGMGILPALGIKIQHTLPYHPQSKSIERFFGTIEEKWISKLPGWCHESREKRPPDFSKKLDKLFKEKKLLTMEEFVLHFKEKILAEYHNTTADDERKTTDGEWEIALSDKTPLEKYNYLEKAKTITPDWNTISILKAHYKENCRVGRYGIRFSNTYYTSDRIASIVGASVDILYYRVEKPYAPSSITVIHNSRFLCEAFPVEKCHFSGDSEMEIMMNTKRQQSPALEMKKMITRIEKSTKRILPVKTLSEENEKSALYDMAYSEKISEEEKNDETKEEEKTNEKESVILKGLSVLFGSAEEDV